MKERSLAALEIEALAWSTLIAAPDRQQPPLSPEDDLQSAPKPETRSHATWRWLVDTLLLAGAGFATLYGGGWINPSNFLAN